MIKTLKIVTTGLCMIVLTAGCAQQDMQDNQADQEADQTTEMGGDTMQTDASDTMDVTATVAVVHPTKDSDVMGTVTFTKEGDGVRVQGNISGLKEGKHGFHIHQYGDCRADDGSSAGGHYNPAGNDHAARTDSVRPMGDMGNITADADGNASVDYVDSVIDMNMIMGRAVVIHGGEDDLTSQPSGAAGARMACGVTGIANPDQ